MLLVIFLLLFDNASSRALRERYLLDLDALQELDSWELKLLRDFARGKGHGSVARLNIDLEGAEEQVDLFDMPQGVLQAGPPSFMQPGSIIAPKSYLSRENRNRSPSISVQPAIEYIPRIKSKTSVAAEHRIPTVGPTARVSSMQRPKAEKQRKSTNSQRNNKPTTEEPSADSFKELARIFQGFIDRRKPLIARPPAVMPPLIPHPQDTMSDTLFQSTSAAWESMDPSDVAADGDETTFQPSLPEPGKREPTKEEWEHHMKQLSEQLSNILMQLKVTKDRRPPRPQPRLASTTVAPQRPRITIIRNGSAEQTADGRYEFVATLSLVRDGGKNILVDTGLGTDINGRTVLLSRLNGLGVAPPQVDMVVTTHGHPDHGGGNSDFPDAVHYQYTYTWVVTKARLPSSTADSRSRRTSRDQNTKSEGWYQHHHTLFNLSGLFESDRHQLTRNVYLTRSAGHSSDDIAVVVEGEATMGTAVIAGDTFLRREDIDYPMMWQPLSANETQQADSRRRIVCGGADWIVPGHGPPFRVDGTVRKKFAC